MLQDINTTSEWINAMASALNEDDLDMAQELNNISEDWVQSEEERNAQYSLFIAVRDAIKDIERLI